MSHINPHTDLPKISHFWICGVQWTPKTVWSGVKDMQNMGSRVPIITVGATIKVFWVPHRPCISEWGLITILVKWSMPATDSEAQEDAATRLEGLWQEKRKQKWEKRMCDSKGPLQAPNEHSFIRVSFFLDYYSDADIMGVSCITPFWVEPLRCAGT